jgi:hypothetical protein
MNSAAFQVEIGCPNGGNEASIYRGIGKGSLKETVCMNLDITCMIMHKAQKQCQMNSEQ